MVGIIRTRASATVDKKTNGGSGLTAGGDPHDPEEGQPPNLEGEFRCDSAFTHATKNDPGRSKNERLITGKESGSSHRDNGTQVEDCSGNTEGGEGRKEDIEIRDLAQYVRRKSEDDKSEEASCA